MTDTASSLPTEIAAEPIAAPRFVGGPARSRTVPLTWPVAYAGKVGHLQEPFREGGSGSGSGRMAA